MLEFSVGVASQRIMPVIHDVSLWAKSPGLCWIKCSCTKKLLLYKNGSQQVVALLCMQTVSCILSTSCFDTCPGQIDTTRFNDMPTQLCDVPAGVKLVLPAILTGVDDSAWRTKQGSIELLGTMAYLAPKQLSTSLPTVVPILGKTLSDPHPKVQASAKKALEEVCLCSIYLPPALLLKSSRTCTLPCQA